MQYSSRSGLLRAAHWLLFTCMISSVVIAQSNEGEIIIKPLSDINSDAYKETNLKISKDGLTMVYTSFKYLNFWQQPIDYRFKNKRQFDPEICFATRVDLGADWSFRNPLNNKVNNEFWQDEAFLSPHEKQSNAFKLTFQNWEDETWQEDGGPYFEVDVDQNFQTMGAIKPIGQRVITQFLVDNGFYATDGMTRTSNNSIIFAAGKDYEEPMDIYYAKCLKEDQFEVPIRLPINTEYDERSVWVSDDNQTLYFSSNRPIEASFGGLDIYKTSFAPDGSTGEVVNIGAPFNTALDEYSFVQFGDRESYFVRDGDIYQAFCYGKLNPKVTAPPKKPVNQVVKKDPPPKTPTNKPKPALLQFEKTNNVVFVLDVSNSMKEADKLPIMTKTMLDLIPNLRSVDRISMITFNNDYEINLNGVDGDQKKLLIDVIQNLNINGGTNGEPAILKSLDVCEDNFIEKGNNVIIVATDGEMKQLNKIYKVLDSYSIIGIQLIILSYGNPTVKTRAQLDRLKKFGGWHLPIDEQNIKESIHKALKVIK